MGGGGICIILINHEHDTMNLSRNFTLQELTKSILQSGKGH